MIERTQGADPGSATGMEALQHPVREELDRVREGLARFFVSDVKLINEISGHMLRANGKLFRPTLLLLANRLEREVSEDAVVAATIVELVHTATLVHDDSIDRSFLRRGIPTVNSLWNDQTSVIMGDYLYSKAFFLMVERGLVEPLTVLAHTTHRMSLGEMLEIEHQLNFGLTEDVYERLIRDKTAVLVAAACEIGALLAWGDGPQRRALAEFGMDLGMAFQIVDDILDIEGDAAVMGKSARSDIRDGKVTLPLIHALKTAPPDAAARVRDLMAGDDLDADGAAEVARFAAGYGGLEHARGRARSYAERARARLDAFAPGSVRQTMHDAVEYVLDRRR